MRSRIDVLPGDRVQPSCEHDKHFKPGQRGRKAVYQGTVAGVDKTDRELFLVLWDGQKTPTRLHRKFIEPLTHDHMLMSGEVATKWNRAVERCGTCKLWSGNVPGWGNCARHQTSTAHDGGCAFYARRDDCSHGEQRSKGMPAVDRVDAALAVELAERVVKLEAALHQINALNDSPARFNKEIQDVLNSVIDTSDVKFERN